MENDDSAVQYAIGRSDTVAPGTGIDLEFDADVQTMSPEASEYETCYVTSHKGPCRVATYSRDGQLIATGSADASIKILDTERMLAKSAMPIEVKYDLNHSHFVSSWAALSVSCHVCALWLAQWVGLNICLDVFPIPAVAHKAPLKKRKKKQGEYTCVTPHSILESRDKNCF